MPLRRQRKVSDLNDEPTALLGSPEMRLQRRVWHHQNKLGRGRSPATDERKLRPSWAYG